MNAPLLLLRSLLFALVFYPVTVVYVIAGALANLLSERALRRVVIGWGHAHRLLCRAVLGQKVRVAGDIPKGRMLYVFKHESMFETIDLLCVFDEPIIIAKQELLDIPGWGGVAQRYGLIGLRRGDGASALRHLKREVMKALETDRPICFFPEGTRVPHGERPPLQSGFAGIYQLLGLSVVPVAIDSGRVSPRKSFIKRPGIITYKVGEVVPPGLPRAQAEALVHAELNALNAPAAGE